MKIILAFFTLCLSINLFSKTDLNEIIKQAEPGSLIELPIGVFEGPITINKPLILKGFNQKSIIKGNGKGDVITILSSHVEIKNLTIQDSGRQRYRLDSGIKVENVNDISITNCVFKKTLFGIILTNSNNSIIANNSITSYKEEVVDNKGDSIRLWGSHFNVIKNNNINKSRDISINRSNNNTIKNNTITNSRYGVLVSMSKDINVSNNKIVSNYIGIILTNSKNVNINKNIITKTHLATGTGIMLKNGTNLHITQNLLTANAQAFYIDSKTTEIGIQRYIKHNDILRNNSAFHFHGIIKNNVITNNNIIGNLEDVIKDIRENKRHKNIIKENYWDRYIGFDKDNDGISDIPYQILIYTDKLWQFNHHLKFFYGTPLLSIIDFMERLAPFTEPLLLLEDTKPKTEPNLNTKEKY